MSKDFYVNKILLSGASGFLGKIIFDYLKSQRSEIFTIGRHNTDDLRCDFSIEKPIINEIRFDLVVHSAGYAHIFPKTNKEAHSFFKVNVNGTANLLKGLENNLPKHFVFISSVAVYGLENGKVINEEYPLLAKDPYGLSKIQAEQLVLEWCVKNNVLCTILRLPLLVGENPPGNLGAMIKAIKKGYYFNIGGGKAKKSMVLAEDVAKFIPTVAAIGGIYNLTDGEHPTFKEISSAIARKKTLNLPLMMAKLIGFVGDFIGEKAPINSLKIRKIISDLTFDDSKARNNGWKSQSVLNYLKNNVISD